MLMEQAPNPCGAGPAIWVHDVGVLFGPYTVADGLSDHPVCAEAEALAQGRALKTASLPDGRGTEPPRIRQRDKAVLPNDSGECFEGIDIVRQPAREDVQVAQRSAPLREIDLPGLGTGKLLELTDPWSRIVGQPC